MAPLSRARAMARMKPILEKLALMSVSLLMLLALEGGLRIAGFGSDDYGALDFGQRLSKEDIYTEDPAQPGTMIVAPWVWEMRRGARRDLLNADTFPRERPEGELRIIAVGESAVFGYPTGGELAFPHRLGVLLNERRPELHARVINLGIPGYEVRRVLRVLQEALRYEPSLVIMYTGHNEYLRRFTMENLENLGWRVRLRQKLQRLRLHQLLAKLLAPVTGKLQLGGVDVEAHTREMEKREGFGQPRSDFETRLVESRYRNNVQLAVDAARAAGVPLAICTVVSQVQAYPKHAVYGKEVTAEQMKIAEDVRFAVRPLSHAQDWVAMEAKAREGLAAVPTHAQFHHFLAQALDGQGRLPEALAEYVQARDREDTQRRGGTAFNDAIREIGAKGGATVVDLEKAFLADMTHGQWGSELFSDYCHPNEAGRDVIAEEIYRAVDWDRLAR